MYSILITVGDKEIIGRNGHDTIEEFYAFASGEIARANMPADGKHSSLRELEAFIENVKDVWPGSRIERSRFAKEPIPLSGTYGIDSLQDPSKGSSRVWRISDVDNGGMDMGR